MILADEETVCRDDHADKTLNFDRLNQGMLMLWSNYRFGSHSGNLTLWSKNDIGLMLTMFL